MKAGRKRRSGRALAGVIVGVRFTLAEHTVIRKAAAAQGLTVSDFIRTATELCAKAFEASHGA